MTEQELREKIARRISLSVEQREWECLTRKVQFDYLEIADQILTLIKEAGYVKLAETQATTPYMDYSKISHPTSQEGVR